MATLVFDIETIGEPWEDLDETTKKVLTRWIERSRFSKEEKEQLTHDLQTELGFSPLTGFLVAIGVYDLERKQGAVYYSGAQNGADERQGDFVLKQRNEREMLEDFWEGARSYDTFVTFNGRSFDVPFLLHRSVAQGVRPSVDLMSGRYLYQQKGVKHIDLLDQLTFYGAMRRRPSLHLFCRAYGIDSPKSAGVTGDDVSELYKTGRFLDLARYNTRDVVATTELYLRWRDSLLFKEWEIDF